MLAATVSIIAPGSASEERSVITTPIVFPSGPSVATPSTAPLPSANLTASVLTLEGAIASEKTTWMGSVKDTLLAPGPGLRDTRDGGVRSTTIVTGELATI
jgi:hypothetical protein